MIVAHTTAFGKIDDITHDKINQRPIWTRRFPPTMERRDAATLLSRPVSSHETVNIEAPRRSNIVSEE